MANKYIKEVEGGQATTLSDTDAFELDTGTESKYIEASDLATEILKRTADLTEDESPTLATTFLPAVDGSGNPIKVAADNIGGGGGMTISSVAVTTSNVTGVEGTLHNLDVSGMTANRDFNLPTPSAADKLCGVRVSTGDNTYALIVKRNGTEVTRIRITDEMLVFQSTGTGAGDWVLIQDGRIRSIGVAERQSAQSMTTGSSTKVNVNTAVVNVGGGVDVTTNYRINIWRTGNYELSAFASTGNVFEDQEFLEVEIYVNGALDKFYASHTSSSTSNRYQSPSLTYKRVLTAGDYVELYIFHNEGANQNTDTTYYPQLSVQELR